MTKIFQLRSEDVEELNNDNYSLFKKFSEVLNDEKTESTLKYTIEKYRLGEKNPDIETKLQEEGLKYFMWLDAERAVSFFAKHVIICEGATEKVAFKYLMSNSFSEYIGRNIYILDSMGKFNILRYMNLFGKLGITHSVLYDRDKDKDIQKIVNDFIVCKKNRYTKKICTFESDFGEFLKIEKAPRKDLKLLNVLKKLKNSEISREKIEELHKMFEELCKSNS